jgi:hypothetical protein
MLDPAVAASTGQENRNRVEAIFGISRMVEAYERLWDSLVSIR